MKFAVTLLLIFFCCSGYAQVKDTTHGPNIVVYKDYRLNLLASRQAEFNTALLKMQARTTRGYRLMILNTSDKEYAFRVRTQLLQRFPEQKPYMWYANPYIRIKFGNFLTKEEADVYKRQISQMLDGANIYYLNETIEIDPGEDFDPDSMRDHID